MQQKIDDLLFERASWLMKNSASVRVIRRLLFSLLSYDEAVKLAETYEGWSTDRIMADIASRIAPHIDVSGLEHIPQTGGALVLANHPTGIADGIIMHKLITERRSDSFVFANRDVLHILPQMADLVAPVEWQSHKKSRAKTKETLDYVKQAVGADRLGLIFPSGRLAKRRGLRLHERPWMPSAAILARKFEMPVIPVHIHARNSYLYYLFDLLHPSLRDITLFHETINKANTVFQVTIGAPISPAKLTGDAQRDIGWLKQQVLALGDTQPRQPRLISSQGFANP